MKRATFLFFVLLLDCPVASAADSQRSKTKNLSPQLTTLSGSPSATLSNINNLSGWYEDRGTQEHWSSGRVGLTYPRGTANAVFTAGLIWAGRFHSGGESYLSLGGQQYWTSTTAGAILGIRTGDTEDPTSPEVRIWRIRRDYAAADLTLDASEFFLTPKPTPDQIDSIRNQYFLDWSGWPWEKGAPFYDSGYLDENEILVGAGNGVLDWGEDANRNGQIDEGEDQNGNGMLDAESPGLADGDQVLWFVCNDIDPELAEACDGSGIEQQTTIWGYEREGAIGEAIFKRHRIIYKGVAETSPDAFIDSLYLGQYMDADVGSVYDDFAGCDTILSLGYAYNARAVDSAYYEFGIPPPAIGNVLLQGPLIHTGNVLDSAVFDFRKRAGYINLPLGEFTYINEAGLIDYPDIYCVDTLAWFRMLQGLPYSRTSSGCHVNPVTSECTRFMLSGDPVTQTGWVDGMIEGPGDRRQNIGSGPVTMILGDTLEIVVALVGGIGSDYLNSVTVLKSNTAEVIDFYNGLVGNVTSVNGEPGTGPLSFRLLQNYPNPFNPSTTFEFSIPTSLFANLSVYNLLGEKVATVVNGNFHAGTHRANWDATGQPSGVYFYRLLTNDFVQTRKLVLVR